MAAVSLLAVAGTAVPAAQADPSSFNGTYAIAGGADGFYVTVSSSCATDGCTANVASNRGWTSVATLTGGRWQFTVTKPDGEVCADGSYAPVVMNYSVDAATLAGMLVADSNGNCPGGQVTQAPFQLRKVS